VIDIDKKINVIKILKDLPTKLVFLMINFKNCIMLSHNTNNEIAIKRIKVMVTII